MHRTPVAPFVPELKIAHLQSFSDKDRGLGRHPNGSRVAGIHARDGELRVQPRWRDDVPGRQALKFMVLVRATAADLP